MKSSLIILLLFISSVILHSQARRIQIELDHATYDEGLSEKEIEIISNNLTKLLSQYIEYGNFQNDDGIFSNENNVKYLNLFTSNAEIYSDLHQLHTITSPSSYVGYVKEHFSDYGFDTVIEFAGLISIDKIITNNYSAKLSLQKLNYANLNASNQRNFFKKGLPVNLNMEVLIDFTNNTYKIKSIESIDYNLIENVELLTINGNKDLESKNQDLAALMIKQPTLHKTDNQDHLVGSKTYEDTYGKEEDDSTKTQANSDQYRVAESSKEQYKYPIQPEQESIPMNTGLALSIGTGNASFINQVDYSSSLKIPVNFQVQYLKSINKIKGLYVSVGISYDKQVMEATMTPSNNTESSYFSFSPISYLRTTREDVMLQVSEENISSTATTMEMTENLEYQSISLPIGIAYNLQLSNKSSLIIASHIVPERTIFKTGNVSTSSNEGNLFPDTQFFPKQEIIQSIEPEILELEEYKYGNNSNQETIYDINKTGLGLDLQLSFSRSITNNLSAFISTSLKYKLLNEVKNIESADQLASYHSVTQNLHPHHKKLNLGFLIKY